MRLSRTAVIRLGVLLLAIASARGPAVAESAPPDKAKQQLLTLMENFVPFAEENWNEKGQCFDAAGRGVSWPRGNGNVCLGYAVLLTELPEQKTFSEKAVPRAVMLDHLKRTLRTLCLSNKNCKEPGAIQPPTWGGPAWQAGLETSAWTWAAWLLRDQLDDDTKKLVRTIATTEADLLKKEIPSRVKNDTGSEDCMWNAAMLGTAACLYDDDPRAAEWDAGCKRWALNGFGREGDRASKQLIDGKPLGEWLEATNVYPDLTLENHGFWSIPYEAEPEALSEADLAYKVRGKKIPAAIGLHADDLWNEILSWLILADGDLVCPQGQDWALRDIQQVWCYAWLGYSHRHAGARQAEQAALDLLTKRQAAFHDGSLHANDFGYQTHLFKHWGMSTLLHKHFPASEEAKAAQGDAQKLGVRVFPFVSVAVCRTPDMVSTLSWADSRQTAMIVPNNTKALGEYPSLTDYDAQSGLGWIHVKGQDKPQPYQVDEPVIDNHDGTIAVSFARQIPGLAKQQVGYVALASGPVIIFSKWTALADIDVDQVVSHPYYILEIDGFLPKREIKDVGPGQWSIDGKLRVQVFGGEGAVRPNTLLGSLKHPGKVRAGDVLEESVCVYQAEAPGKAASQVSGTPGAVTVAGVTIERAADGKLRLVKSPKK